MEKLMDIAKKHADQVEIFSIDKTNKSLKYTNDIPKDLDYKKSSGISIRLIKDGKIGFAYTKNLRDRKQLVENALKSLKGGVEAGFDFPLTKSIKNLDTYSDKINNISSEMMVKEAERITNKISSRGENETLAVVNASESSLRIINSAGSDLATKFSSYYASGNIIMKGSASSIGRMFVNKDFKKMPDKLLNEVLNLYNQSKNPVEPNGGKMKVLFMPSSSITYLWRLLSGTSGENLYKKVTPLADKINEKVFSEKLTIYNDPTNDNLPGARSFDDEGVKTKSYKLIDKGVFKKFYNNLNYAHKLDCEPTGNGFRSGMWGGDEVTLRPSPSVSHLRIQKGNSSFKDLISMMDKGIIVEGVLGAHSGNIPNGDYSVGMSPGIYVENGTIRGIAKDIMVAGNIYDTLKNIVAVGDTNYFGHGGYVPPLLCENVSVSNK
ncbi:MAG: TldD/PmbA family protein [Candidatus Mcinerneyibacterium aminivorans]|uniref:TldD/PmbA family protein n=1 Tax=Candidatus Mcinerneyibacterium aminivorans TaxID=2703815 RepID=A0A5D0MGD9_9BACT|nr:MAG: TldD/PmbA family protein [Candidatus Mcinerneyibacterium aminivorans]